MEETYKLLEKINKERLRDERALKNSLGYKSKTLYSNYWAWCRANIIDTNDYKNFKKFIKKTNTQCSFWIKKAVFEKYFGFEFTFNYEQKKWNARSIK